MSSSPAALIPTVAGAGAGDAPPKRAPKRFIKTSIPASLLTNPALTAAISLLPSNYNFEIHKTIHRILTSSARTVALQFPDGLLMFALPISDILRSFTSISQILILAEPTYGACCLDDFAAKALNADLLIHYGHSCLVPVTSSIVPSLYVFVEITIDPARLLTAVTSALPGGSRIALAGTVQFLAAVHAARGLLTDLNYSVIIPQAKPLSAGEVLGCTAPTLPKSTPVDAVVFVADGRFHLEAFMIANPTIPAFRYDPYLGVIILEKYDNDGMMRARREAIEKARGARKWGVVLGTLGRQGSTRVLDRILEHMEERGKEYTVVMMSELSPARIAMFGESVDAWVQIACPRLSIDWGEGFGRPVLTTFEMEIALGYIAGWWEKERRKTVECVDSSVAGCCSASGGGCGKGSWSCSCSCGDTEADYPMDYYAQDGGDWNGSYIKKKSAASDVKRRSSIGDVVQLEPK